MGTKNEPGQFDCYANAEPDEPMFILLARDKDAADLVRYWAYRRQRAIHEGSRPDTGTAMVGDALKCAKAMDDWRKARDERRARQDVAASAEGDPPAPDAAGTGA